MRLEVYDPLRHEAAVLALRANVWGATHPHTNAEFYRWLFRDTPDGKGSGIMAFNAADQLVGFAGISCRSGQYAGQAIKICHGLEFMVDPAVPKMRSGKLAGQILTAHRNLAGELGYDCAVNYPNSNSFRMIVSRFGGYDLVFEPELIIRPLWNWSVPKEETGNALKRVTLTFGGKAASVYSSLRAAACKSPVEIRAVPRFDADFDRFWQRLTLDGRLHSTRDSRMLNWRYVDHPLYRYERLAAYRDGEVVGFIVVSPRQIMAVPALLVCDFAIPHDDPNVAEALVMAAVRLARAQKIGVIASQIVQSDRRRAMLLRCGFIPVPRRQNPKQFRLVARTFTPVGAPVNNAENWSFGWGDMDVV